MEKDLVPQAVKVSLASTTGLAVFLIQLVEVVDSGPVLPMYITLRANNCTASSFLLAPSLSSID